MDSETRAVFDKFVAGGGDAATFYRANPELGAAPATAPAKGRPALTEGDKAILQVAGAMFDIATAKAWASLRKSARGRQGR